MIEFKEMLVGDTEIMNYIESMSEPGEESFATYYRQYQEAFEMLNQMFSEQNFMTAHTAKLETVPIEDIIEGDPDYNRRNFKKEAGFMDLDPKTIPPIVVNSKLEIEDGNHRYRVAKKLGLKTLRCYVIQNKTEY